MKLSEEDRAELRTVLKPGGYDRSVAARAQIVLWWDEEYRKVEIAAMSGASRPTVNKWLTRYALFGLEGLVSRCSPGAPRQIPGQIRARVLGLKRS
ncbi:MAG: helix-turn-helix domain-containing protein [Actinobacteria bacterium]|nr:helix-turn-helix domain-containing protein [Acidobacteriota bacterium]MCA1682142.1 helix-turn-helix domain-containing protein [Actinomycetota bacterium]